MNKIKEIYNEIKELKHEWDNTQSQISKIDKEITELKEKRKHLCKVSATKVDKIDDLENILRKEQKKNEQT